jgi:hypothetical protein
MCTRRERVRRLRLGVGAVKPGASELGAPEEIRNPNLLIHRHPQADGATRHDTSSVVVRSAVISRSETAALPPGSPFGRGVCDPGGSFRDPLSLSA